MLGGSFCTSLDTLVATKTMNKQNKKKFKTGTVQFSSKAVTLSAQYHNHIVNAAIFLLVFWTTCTQISSGNRLMHS